MCLVIIIVSAPTSSNAPSCATISGLSNWQRCRNREFSLSIHVSEWQSNAQSFLVSSGTTLLQCILTINRRLDYGRAQTTAWEPSHPWVTSTNHWSFGFQSGASTSQMRTVTLVTTATDPVWIEREPVELSSCLRLSPLLFLLPPIPSDIMASTTTTSAGHGNSYASDVSLDCDNGRKGKAKFISGKICMGERYYGENHEELDQCLSTQELLCKCALSKVKFKRDKIRCIHL